MSAKFLYFLNSDLLGNLKLQNNPIGWDTVKFHILRDPQYKGIKREFSSFDLNFIKEGRAYLQAGYEEKGVEWEVAVDVYEYFPNEKKWKIFFNGKINFDKYIIDDTTVTVNVKQVGKTDRFMNLDDTVVNMASTTDLDGNPITPFIKETQTITLHSKSIIKKSEQTGDPLITSDELEDSVPVHISAGTSSVSREVTKYFQFEFISEDVKELSETFIYGAGWVDIPGEFYNASEAGILNIDHLKIDTKMDYLVETDSLLGGIDPRISGCSRGDGKIGYYTIQVILQQTDSLGVPKRTEVPLIVGGSACGLWVGGIPKTTIEESYLNFNVEVGDKFFLYGKVVLGGRYNEATLNQSNLNYIFKGTNFKGNHLKFSSLTSTPSTESKGILVHEAFSRWAQFIFGEKISFYSDFYGRTDSEPIKYIADGEGSLEWFSNGFNIRGFKITDKPIYFSFKELFQFEDASFCLGAGIETMSIQEGPFLLNSDFETSIDEWMNFAGISWNWSAEEGGCAYIQNEAGFHFSTLRQFYDFTEGERYKLKLSLLQDGCTKPIRFKVFVGVDPGSFNLIVYDSGITSSSLENMEVDIIAPLIAGGNPNNVWIEPIFDNTEVTTAKLKLSYFKVEKNAELKEVIRVEKQEYFFKDEIILDLGCVKKLKKSVALEYYYNSLSFGYSKWKNEEVNNLDEFNAVQNWTNPLTTIKNELNLNTPDYIGSGYSMEFTRRERYTESSTKDTTYDNDNFVVCILRDGLNFITERIQQVTTISGVIDPSTIYNLRRSPKRAFYRWGHVIKAGLLHQLDRLIKFSNGEGNYTMSSKMTGEPSAIVENADVLVSSLRKPLYIPEYYEFEKELTRDQLEIIRNNTYGKIKFKHNNDIMSGFIVEIMVDRGQNNADFKLLRAYNNEY